MSELVPNSLLDTRFRIVRKLGEGGFGEVYEAIDEPLERSVAIKVLKPTTMTDAESRRRFLREGKILSKLHAKNLVQLFSVNMSEDGLLYMVMELVAGMTLREKLNTSGKLTEQEVIPIATAVVGALGTLNAAGVVHRDLKPDNIMLTGDDLFPIKLLDFGLSGLLSRNIADDTRFTSQGLMVGSVHYMAPECCVGEGITIGADFYALGCVLYECLTGGPPFTGPDAASVIFRHVNNMPMDPRVFSPDISDSTCSILVRLLQKDSDARYENCDQLSQAFESNAPGNYSPTAPLLIPFQSSLPPRPDGPRKLLIAISLLLTASVSIGLIVLCSNLQQSKPSGISDYKIVKLVNNLFLDTPRTIAQVNLGKTIAEQEEKVSRDVPGANFDGRVTELITALRTEPRSSRHSLDSQTLSYLLRLNAKLEKLHWQTALDLGLATLHCLANEEEVNIKQMLPMFNTVMVQATVHIKELAPGTLEELKQAVLQATKNAQGSDEGKIEMLCSIFNLLQSTQKEVDPAILSTIATIEQDMPIHALVPHRGLFFSLATSCVINKNPAAKEFLRILIRIDKETIKTHPENLGYDYLVMSELVKDESKEDFERFSNQSMETYALSTVLPLDRFGAYFMRARYLTEDGKLDEARKLLRQTELLQTKLTDRSLQLLVRRGICQGWYELDRKTPASKTMTPDANEVLNHAVVILAALPKSSPEAVETYLTMAITCKERGQQAKALQYAEKANLVLSTIKKAPEELRVQAHCKYGALLVSSGSFAKSARILAAVENSPALAKRDTGELVEFYRNLGTAQLKSGALKEALRSFEQEQSIRKDNDKDCQSRIEQVRAKLASAS